MIDIQKLEKNFAKDLNNLRVLVTWAAQQQVTGSFSARRPDLGKMFTCPFCGTRRRQGSPKCCNPIYAKTQRAWDAEQGFYQAECPERVHAQFFSKSFLKKLMHKRHGQSRLFKIRQVTYLFQNDAKFLESAVKEMQERWPLLKAPGLAEIPVFAEKWWRFKQEQRDQFYRRQTSRSRQINRREA